MKNIFKFFGIAFVASTLMVACDPNEQPTTPTTPQYTITVSANNPNYGTVSGGGVYDSAATATLTATANEGYRFVGWADGNNNNPRIVTVTADASFTANFEENAGVNVTFGETSWTAQYTNVQYLNQGGTGAILVAASQTATTNQAPIIQLVNIWQGAPTTGSYTGSHVFTSDGLGREGAYLYYYEVLEDAVQLQYQDGSTETIGDWWNHTLDMNITALDADAMTISLVVNANMVHGRELLEGETSLDNCTHRTLTLNVINQSMTPYSGKAALKANKGVAKIAR